LTNIKENIQSRLSTYTIGNLLLIFLYMKKLYAILVLALISL